jgi:transcriptional regulator with XRE-family HTH domain
MTSDNRRQSGDQVAKSLGRALRALRTARQISVAELAGDTGYSESYLGQVESGATVPSLSALATIAASLGSDLTAFFPSDDHERVWVSRAGDPHKLRIAPSATEEYTVLTARGPDAAFSALIHRIFPSEATIRYRHLGERFAMVREGRMALSIGGEQFDLGPGDTIHYSSHPEHELRVISNGPAEILWLVSPAII